MAAHGSLDLVVFPTMSRVAAIVLVLLASVASAQESGLINSDRPGLADSSAVVGARVFQLEAGLERDHDFEGRSLSAPLLLRCGISNALELRIEGDGYVHSDGGSGFAPLSLGVIARVFVPSGTGSQRSHTTTGDLRLAADIDLSEKWSINPNIGVASQDDGDGRFTAGLAALTLQYSFSDRANVFVDGAAQTPERRGGSTSLIVDTGAAWIIGRDTQFDISAGWGARGSTAPNVFWSAGISRRF